MDLAGSQGVQVGSGNIQINNYGAGASRGVRRPWMAPARSSVVVARPALMADLLAVVIAGDEAAVEVTAAVEGAGGFGKTTLAGEIARSSSVDARFPGGLLWVTVGEYASGADLAGLVGGLCRVLSGEPVTESDPMVAGGLLGSLLDERDPVLLVVDDVWRVEQLAPFLVGGRSCRRLVTTRNVGAVPGGSRRVLVDEMTVAEAVETLTANLPLPTAGAAGLLRWTGRWPVLLGLVNAALVELVGEGASADEAVVWVTRQLMAAGPVAFDDPDAVHDPVSRSRAVAATVEASVGLLTPEQRGRYLDLVVFPEDVDVPVDALAVLWGASGLGGSEAERFRRRLVQLRLASGRFVGGQPALRLHDVLRSYLHVAAGAGGVADAHRRFLAAARGLVTGGRPVDTGDTPSAWWELPGTVTGDYFRHHLAYHLTAAGAGDEAAAVVCDLRWVETKIARFGYPVGIEADLARVDTPTSTVLRRAIGQAAHLLTPLAPGRSLAVTLASRLGEIAGLEQTVAAFRSHLTGPRFGLAWPMPDLPHPAHLRTLTGHTKAINTVAFSADGQLLASASDDGTVRLWEITTGTSRVLTGHTDIVTAAVFSPDGTQLATSSYDRTVRVWELTTGTARVLTGHTDVVGALTFSDDGQLLASASDDTTVCLWEIATGSRRVLTGHGGGVSAVAFSPDSNRLASTATDGGVRLWQIADGSCQALAGHTDVVTAVAFSTDGQLLATSSYDATVRLWTIAPTGSTPAVTVTGQVLTGHSDMVNALAFSPDGTLLATAAGGNDRSVRLWDRASGTSQILVGHTSGINTLGFSSDGTLLASASDDGTAHLWNLHTGTGHRLTAQTDRMNTLAFAPDGTQLASAASDGTVHLWDVPAGLLHTGAIPTRRVNALAFSPDGTLLASAASDGTVELADVATRTGRIFTGHTAWVGSVAFSPDGLLLASASDDGTVRLRDVPTGAESILVGHASGVAAVVFSPDGRILASASDDGTVRLWDIPASITRATSRILTGHTDWIGALVVVGSVKLAV
ncbi:hypothetical protein CC117_33155 [Parafrankia colletiae]|uniref:NB-ARC domain-containing protein n=1 Tax=Parafrankia colletiae TaxID=573497 RepID=A0A1S1R922_9ACTN|nr:NB-ARC domain-containing protein [Parafrankia colletiae]MCK9905110.1 NB-ARC domain-containing protein [Frankia sp. Cpl3]OHV41985.1 hypothetical protein CC117_33155 [Parafrankia colletiae]